MYCERCDKLGFEKCYCKKTFPKYFIPTQEFVESLQVGDMVPDCFNHVSPIVEIVERKEDINGKLFCYYRQQFHENSTITGSMKVGRMHRHLWQKETSWELDKIEQQLREEMGL